MLKLTAILVGILALTPFAKAQSEDEIRNQQTLFYDECSFGEYKVALEHLDWLIKNAPESSENIYKKGATILDKLIKNESDPETLKDLHATALNLYKTRFDLFGPNYKVKNTELTRAYQYWNKSPKKYEELLNLFRSTADSYPEHISNSNLLAYMDIVRRTKKYVKNISDEQVLEEYNRISSILQSRPLDSDADTYATKINQMLAGAIELNCTTLDDLLGNKLTDDLESVASAKLFVNLSNKVDCRDESFNKAIDIVLKYDPTAPIALYKAKSLMKDKALNDAEHYFGVALTLTDDPDLTSDTYLNLARIYTLKEDKIKAQNFAYKAINVNKNKKAYSLIGNLYLTSFSECTEDKDIVARRAVYIAAYDMFEKADDQENMVLAKGLFPSASEIHMNNYSQGQQVEVNCWFKKTVVLDKRN